MDTLKEEPKEMVKPSTLVGRRKWSSKDKQMATVFTLVHLLSLLAPFYFNWSAFWVAFALYIATSLFGITVSYHRNLSHKSFKVPKWLEYLFAYCGLHSVQGDPIFWVRTHRTHHQYVDTELDPHSPVQRFWYGYVIWLFDSKALSKKIYPKNINDPQDMGRNIVGDLERQPFYKFLRKTYILHPIALAVLLYAIGGIPFLTWGMGVRIILSLHMTFMVNSICHTWGKQPWNTGDFSRNNWWMSLLFFGEGWHNNHHAFEYSARMGLEWWELDFGWYVIKFLEAIGVATNVKFPSQSNKQKFAKNRDQKKAI